MTCKGFQWLRFDGFTLVNTHVQASYAHDSAQAEHSVQFDQLMQIYEFLEGVKGGVIIVGDLNVDGIAGPFTRRNDMLAESQRVKFAFDMVKNEHPRSIHDNMPSLGAHTSKSYHRLMKTFPGFKDLCMEMYGIPPVTFRDCDIIDGRIIEQDHYLNPKKDLCSC